jgi:hypothetical protein
MFYYSKTLIVLTKYLSLSKGTRNSQIKEEWFTNNFHDYVCSDYHKYRGIKVLVEGSTVLFSKDW